MRRTAYNQIKSAHARRDSLGMRAYLCFQAMLQRNFRIAAAGVRFFAAGVDFIAIEF